MVRTDFPNCIRPLYAYVLENYSPLTTYYSIVQQQARAAQFSSSPTQLSNATTTPTKSSMAVRRIAERLLVSTRQYTTRPHPTIDRVIRIDHAGEFGANRIYEGQMAVLGNTSTGPIIQVDMSSIEIT